MNCPICGRDDYPHAHNLGVVLPGDRKRVSLRRWLPVALAAAIIAGTVLVWKVLT